MRATALHLISCKRVTVASLHSRVCLGMGRVESHCRWTGQMRDILVATASESEIVTRHVSSRPVRHETKQEFRVGDPVISDALMKSLLGQTSEALHSQASICVSKSLCLQSTVRERYCHHKVAAAKGSQCSPLLCGLGGPATRKLHS